MSPRTEAELLDATIDLATHTGWAIHHDRPARRAGTGWATHIAGHAGFPDLVLARRGIVLIRELKGYQANGRIGRLSSEQRDWAHQLSLGGQFVPVTKNEPLGYRLHLVFDVWTPDDWDPLIVPTLTARVSAGAR